MQCEGKDAMKGEREMQWGQMQWGGGREGCNGGGGMRWGEMDVMEREGCNGGGERRWGEPRDPVVLQPRRGCG